MFSITRASSIADLPEPVAVCCHDAGAANLIAAWVAEHPGRDYRLCAEGPARSIFAKMAPSLSPVAMLGAIESAGCLLSGSGWASSLEHDSRIAALRRGLPTLAVLDHWVNYRMRFSREGIETLPDAFVVTDRDAALLAQETFGGARPVLMWPNRYLEREVTEVRRSTPRTAAGTSRLLVLLEPIRKDWLVDAAVPAEFRALDYLIENLGAVFPDPDRVAVRLRLHPSESAAKYLPWMERAAHPSVSISASASLSEDIAWADVAAGLESYALIVALASGRRSISYLPSGAPGCSLRHSGLEHLSALVSAPA